MAQREKIHESALYIKLAITNFEVSKVLIQTCSAINSSKLTITKFCTKLGLLLHFFAICCFGKISEAALLLFLMLCVFPTISKTREALRPMCCVLQIPMQYF